jgi:aminopeptidase
MVSRVKPQRDWHAVAVAVANGLRIADGESVSVFLTDADSFPLVEAFCAEVYRRGAEPHIILADERIDRLALRFSTPEKLAHPSHLESVSLREADVHVSFRGMVPPSTLSESISTSDYSERLAAQRKAKGIISSLRWEYTRWAIVRVPTRQWAEFVGVDVDQLFEEFFDGCLLNWEAVLPGWKEIARRLDATEVVRVISADTDLSLRVAGRTAAVFAGEANWPDGEVATAPLNDGVAGFITFPEAFWFAGQRVKNLRLEFEHGTVRSISADDGEEVARALIATDSGAKRIGELGIGLNPLMKTMTGDLLLDEKILGSIHIALGRAYPENGGTNQSSLHWDIVKDLRPTSGGGAGSLFLDGEPLILEGRGLWL